jgi:hypothetical protein
MKQRDLKRRVAALWINEKSDNFFKADLLRKITGSLFSENQDNLRKKFR